MINGTQLDGVALVVGVSKDAIQNLVLSNTDALFYSPAAALVGRLLSLSLRLALKSSCSLT